MSFTFFIISLFLSSLSFLWSDIWYAVFCCLMLSFGLLLCHKDDTPFGRSEQKLFLFCFTVYFIFTIAVVSCIHDPWNDYFINCDSNMFYGVCEDYENTPISESLTDFFTLFQFHEVCAGFSLRLLLHKLGILCGVSDLYLFSALSNVLVASLIPVMILKILRATDLLNGTTIKMTYLFAVFSPIMMDLPELTRDLHIMLIYTAMMYCFCMKRLRFRYLYMLLLSAAVYCFRNENGLFAGLILFTRIWLDIQKFRLVRIALIPVIIGLGIAGLLLLFPIMKSVLEAYSTRGVEMASNESFAVKIFTALPFPLDICGKTVFGQLLPFPVTVTLTYAGVAAWATFVSWFTPFFWGPVQVNSILFFLKERKNLFLKYRGTVLLYLCAIVYIILISAGQAAHRRMMAMYPAIFLFFCISVTDSAKSFKRIALIVSGVLVLLHMIYYLLKA